MTKFWRRQRDERGAILILSTVGVVLAVVAAALAVDLGSLAQERRRDQKVADLAALDAIRDVPANYQARAVESAGRNGFPTGTGFSVVAVEGHKSGGACVTQAGEGKVCVTIVSPSKNNFVPGTSTIVARAVAGPVSQAGFWMGSSLLSANLDDAAENLPLLNRVFGRLLAGASGQANVLSYKGLADASVKLRDLQAALNFASPQQLLTSNITMGQLLTATAAVLNTQGASSVAAYNDVIRLQNTVTNQAQFKLGDYLKIAQGYEDKALDSNFNVFDLIAGGAEVINKNNVIDAGTVVHLPLTGAPLVGSTIDAALKLKVIEGPKHYFGPVGGSVSTSQMEVTLTSQVNVTSGLNVPTWLLNLLSLLGSENLQLHGAVNAKYTAGGATGTLAAVRCSGANQGITVHVDSQPVTTHVDGSLQVYDASVSLLNLINTNVKVNVAFSPPDVNTLAGSQDLTFAYPNEFYPTDPDGKSTSGTPVGITLAQTGANSVSTTAGAAGLLNTLTTTLNVGVGVNTVGAAIINPILNPILSAMAQHLTTPALKALGVSIGPVDVWPPADEFDPAACGQPGLLG